MTATEVLRRMLDERGVEWGNIRNDGSESDYLTEWQFENNQGSAIAIEWAVGSGLSVEIHRYHLTPEQAITATLGSSNCTNGERTNGTCHTVAMDCFGNPPYNTSGLNGNSTACGCSECGAPWSTMGIFRGNQLKHNFKACPICGRKVVDA